MNPFAIASFSIARRKILLKVPFITALGRKDWTENVQIGISLRSGVLGSGEASGSVVNAQQSPAHLAAVLRRLAGPLKGRDARALAALTRDIWRQGAATPSAAAALECALTDAVRRALGLGWNAWFGGGLKKIATDLTLSAAPPAETRAAAQRAAAEGFTCLKIKVGTGASRDLARAVAADAAGRHAGRRPTLILDGNQRLGRAGALSLTEACLARGLRVVLLEQPVPAADLSGLAWVTRRSPVPVAADESVQGPQDARRVLESGAASVVNIKTAKMGLLGALETIAVARSAGARLMIGCMQESSLGLSASVGLALGTGAFSFIDLDSDWLLEAAQPAGCFERDGPWLRAS